MVLQGLLNERGKQNDSANACIRLTCQLLRRNGLACKTGLLDAALSVAFNAVSEQCRGLAAPTCSALGRTPHLERMLCQAGGLDR